MFKGPGGAHRDLWSGTLIVLSFLPKYARQTAAIETQSNSQTNKCYNSQMHT